MRRKKRRGAKGASEAVSFQSVDVQWVSTSPIFAQSFSLGAFFYHYIWVNHG